MSPRRAAVLLLLLGVACREQPSNTVAEKIAKAKEATASSAPPKPDDSVKVNIIDCAQNVIALVNVDPETLQITHADGQTIDRSTELRGNSMRSGILDLTLDGDKDYVVEARPRSMTSRVERVLRCGTSEPLRSETAPMTFQAFEKPLIRCTLAAHAPAKVSYVGPDGVEHDVPVQTLIGSASGDVDGPSIKVSATKAGDHYHVTISADDPSGVESITYTLEHYALPQPYTKPLDIDPHRVPGGSVTAIDKAGNRSQIAFKF